MEKRYIIIGRYEHWTNNGKVFTRWFPYNTNPMSIDEAKEKIKEMKQGFVFIDKKTKLKHEYDVKLFDEYQHEQDEMTKNIEKINKSLLEYKQSAEYKELQKKKRQAAKERKERQKKYLEEHANN